MSKPYCEALPELAGIRFVDAGHGAEGNVRWTDFKAFLSDTKKNGVNVICSPESKMGEWRVYILKSDLDKVLFWMQQNQVQYVDGVFNIHDQ